MLRLSRILAPGAAATFLALAPAPSAAFVGYGVEAGTPLYDALQHGYRPAPYFDPYHDEAPRRNRRRIR